MREINLHERRQQSLDVVSIYLKELGQINLETVQCGDWIEGIGTIGEYALIGFLHHLGRHGFKLVKECLK